MVLPMQQCDVSHQRAHNVGPAGASAALTTFRCLVVDAGQHVIPRLCVWSDGCELCIVCLQIALIDGNIPVGVFPAN